jgi:hypothetical protein
MSHATEHCCAIADRFEPATLRCWCGLHWDVADDRPPCPMADNEPVTHGLEATPHDSPKKTFTRDW